MNKPRITTEDLQNLKLSQTAKERMQHTLSEYADFHAVDASVRAGTESRSHTQVSSQSWFAALFMNSNRMTMPALGIVALLLVGSGTSFAAQGSVPGDTLYPVKITINENIREAMTFGDEAEARLAIDLLEERIAEAEQLEAEGKLTGELALAVEAEVAEQAEVAARASAETDPSFAVAADADIRLALESFTAITGDTLLAIGDGPEAAAMKPRTMGAPERTEDRMGIAADEDTAVMSQLALEPMPLEDLRANTQVRIDALEEIVIDSQAELEASVYSELTATLDDAAVLMTEAEAQTEAEARETLTEAADLAGRVEATLSTLGTVEIDMNTGIIVDIDFDNVPPTSLELESRSNTTGEVEALEDLEARATSGLEATSGLRLE